jgi:hypothetical protein
MNDLKSLGYGDWFQNRVNHQMIAVHDVARGVFLFIKIAIP